MSIRNGPSKLSSLSLKLISLNAELSLVRVHDIGAADADAVVDDGVGEKDGGGFLRVP